MQFPTVKKDWKSRAFKEQLKETILDGFTYNNKLYIFFFSSFCLIFARFSFFFYSSSTLREGSPKIWFVHSDPSSPIPDAKSLYHALGIIFFSPLLEISRKFHWSDEIRNTQTERTCWSSAKSNNRKYQCKQILINFSQPEKRSPQVK